MNGEPIRPCPKPDPRQRGMRRRQSQHRAMVAAVRAYVFDREAHGCRVCRRRFAQSMHELVPRSLGGRVSKRNSIAVCGSGTTGCHGFLQHHQIVYDASTGFGAEGMLLFTPRTAQAAEHLRAPINEWIISLPRVVEREP